MTDNCLLNEYQQLTGFRAIAIAIPLKALYTRELKVLAQSLTQTGLTGQITEK